ncbi:MAG: bifunctional riboflavin kinase/FAD synthetase [Desulfobacterota bacterium]|nr:bifunctional riboflavin kinase/FAD synthetase [Thermodesulfobacteriota bacterium]MDW8001796.1 bifunctional riboflavin kinase/FAD synthetase [Deltaproteobacteria bacterium]
MKVIEGLEKLQRLGTSVITIGNFDGVHIGHRKIIEEARKKAEELNATFVVLTFDPHPLFVLKPENINGLITPLPVKKRILEEMGVDVLVVLKFDETLRDSQPEVFFRKVLIDRIGVSAVILGSDFRFGKDQKGNVELVETLSKKYGVFFKKIDPVTIDGEKVGSNKIRKLLLDGEIRRANELLGRPFTIVGKVVYGAGIGKKIGFPTANLAFLENQILPKNGVYVTETEFQGNYLPSVTNIGFKPTFNYNRICLETHILGFNQDIYGMELEVRFYERIRDEQKFDSVEGLKTAIAEDISKARAFLSRLQANALFTKSTISRSIPI